MSTTPPQPAHPSLTDNDTGTGLDVPRDLHQSLDPAERMQAGVDLAVALIPACDHAGITLVSGKDIRSGATSDGLVTRADQIQHDLAQGPCVDAARWENRSLYVSDLATETRWPQWTVQVRQELGVGSLLSMLLFTHERSYGAMNLYADHPDAFTGDDFAIAENLAAHLAVAVSDSTEIQHRGTGMINRTVIGQAEGILMERFTIGSTEAFAFLRRTSQDTNRKLLHIAEDLVRTRHLPDAGQRGHQPAAATPTTNGQTSTKSVKWRRPRGPMPAPSVPLIDPLTARPSRRS